MQYPRSAGDCARENSNTNRDGTAYTLGAVSATGPFNAPNFVSNTPGQVDGFGQFDLSLNFFDG